uniref:Uncharacterized protein n=1 Tax=Oryza sativa subsp. japonica TaxID=39947 RepID=Q6H538_ORYSJ|nr:hypothetical protein [Oryza sativa Japonica Group]
MAATPTTREDAPMATMIGTALGSGGVIATSKATSKSYKAACTLSLATCLPSLPSDKCLKAAFAAATSLLCLTAGAPPPSPRRFPHRCRGPRIPQVWVQAVQEHDGDDEDIGGYSRGDDDREDAAATTREKGGDGSYDA